MIEMFRKVATRLLWGSSLLCLIQTWTKFELVWYMAFFGMLRAETVGKSGECLDS